MIILSRRAGRRTGCGASPGGVGGAAFPAALLGLILCASAISCARAKADFRVGQDSRNMTPLRVDDAIQSHVTEASRRFHIPADWIWAVMHAESAGDVRARSKKGAMGLMQIMPATWAMLRVRQGLGDDPYDPRDNILAGAGYLRDLHDRYGARGFLAAYNAGPGRYEDHLSGRRPLPAETMDYVSTVGRRIDSGVAPDAATPADERIPVQRAPLFPGSIIAPSAEQSTDEARSVAAQSRDEERFILRSPVDQPGDEARSIGGTSAEQSMHEDRALSRTSVDRVAVDLSAIAPSSAGLFVRVTSR